MKRPARARVEGPLSEFADGFRAELAGEGYTVGSTEHLVRVMAKLSSWLASQHRAVANLDETVVDQFAAGRERPVTRRAARRVLAHLRVCGVVTALTTSPPSTPLDGLLDDYRHHLIAERDLAVRTVGRYEATARRFLGQRAQLTDGGLDIDGLTSADVTAFLLAECARLSVGPAKGLVGEMRSLLRFLHLAGLVPTALGDALPSVAGWHDQKLPPTLGSTAVAALLASCNLNSVVGRRDFAILTVLARLGLRAAEVASMQLDDVDWRAGELVVRGKGRRLDRLPLPVDVGEALADYLCRSRPRFECRTMFVTYLAPWRPLHPNTVSAVVLSACRRAGLAPVRAHRLRHALASEMVRRGTRLEEVSQVLRHRDVATTAIYTKVDSDLLRSVASEWPGCVA